ncbi:Uma2 family endonuclease [Crocosphaera sp. XPORK-15E]|uniref:Uma2 family endonuclease n=1 Tax=Crocosphaera sp. XPORK-15E TaxID=3110247 RepID=UPI002B20A75F|nr:Uma2 family endonuclease [Crocosphaera sp. XPORK-15E]MEA5534405.1 Uma2 family endonuclease [Crocosphaera sp. XPORK-15E]
MVIAPQIMSLEDYLNYDDDTDSRYELEDGELLVMPPESDRNLRIASFLFAYFLQMGIPSYRLRIGTEVVVSGTRATVRLPDLMVLTEELAIALQSASRSTVTMDMPPPQLVVEVVSPGKKNVDRDYRYKRSQYQARGIAEYWIVDPIEQRITVLSLVEGLYEEAIFEGNGAIASAFLSELGQGSQLTAAQVLQITE